jgi:hypothetical protein
VTAQKRSAAPPDAVAKTRAELRAPRAAGVAGLLFSALFIFSLVAARPPAGQSAESLARWYAGGSQVLLGAVGLYAIPFAGIAFLWFIGVVRDRIAGREDRLFSTVFLGSGLLFVAMLFTAAASASAMALRLDIVSSQPLNAGVIQFAQALTNAFLYVYAARAAGVFMIVTSTIALRTKSVPRWVSVVGYIIAALLLLSIRYFELIMLLFPLWVTLLSIFFLITPPVAAAEVPGEVEGA